MTTTAFKVDGMKCGGCSGRLKKALEATEGIASTDIVLETKQVTVAFDAARIDTQAIKNVIEEVGFSVIDS
jgi:copper chaperone